MKAEGAGGESAARSLLTDASAYVFGGLLMGISVQYFAAPNNISVGGVNGLATLVNYMTGGAAPIGLVSLAINIPLFIFAFLKFERTLFFKTLIGTVVSSVMIDVMGYFTYKPYSGDMLVAALFSGVAGGVGLGLIFLRGATTGGTDIVGRLLKYRFPHMEIGKLLMIIEGVVLICTTLVYRNINNALYSIISIYTYTKFVDTVLYGIDYGKSYIVITEHPREIAKKIMTSLDRGVTLIKGIGAYTGRELEVILTAVRNSETGKLREIVRTMDPSAFIIVTATTETIGEGFKSIGDNK